MTITFLLTAAIWGLTAQRAGAYLIAGRPWPEKHLSYYSLGSKKANRMVDRAARIWNRADVGVHFVRSPSNSARVLVSGAPGRCRGKALIGYPGAEASWLRVGRCPANLMVLIVAHEFGHVLGLGHERRYCALMNAGVDSKDGTPSRCRRHSLAYWLKHPLLPDDIRGARILAASSGAANASASAPHAASQRLTGSAPRLYDFTAGLLSSA